MSVGNSQKITLFEADISGASLSGKTPSQLTIPELKRWLSCRKGAKLGGTKRALIDRVQSYIDGGLDKDLIDPDNGENIARKRRQLAVELDNNVAVAGDDEFMFPPSTAMWKAIADGRTLLPEFSLANLMTYFVTRKVCDGQSAGDFKHVNNHSYPLFKAGHIQRIRVIKGNDDNVYLNAVCLPEMRKDREYKIQIILSPAGDILFAEDGCPAGKGPKGSCKHIAAFCYALEEFVRLGFTRPFLSCTSRLQTWNQPRKKKLDSKSIYEIPFERAEYGKIKKAHLKPFPQEYNAIPPKHRRENLESTEKLAQLCTGLSKPCGFLKVLNTRQRESAEQMPLTVPSSLDPSHPATTTSFTTLLSTGSTMQTTPVLSVHNPGIFTSPVTLWQPPLCVPSSSTDTTGEPLPADVPSVLNMLPATPLPTLPSPFCADFCMPLTSANIINTPSPFPSHPLPTSNVLPPSKKPGSGVCLTESLDLPIKLPLIDSSVSECPIVNNLSDEAKLLLDSTVRVNFDQAAAIESSTRKQSENIDWFRYRQCRLTASNFGAVLKRKKQDCSKLVERLTNSQQNLNVSSLNYGRDNEDIVADYYVQYQERHGHPGIKVFPCGLIVNPNYSWLGASPDRIVYDPTSNPPYGGLEIKCIESGKGMTPLQAYQSKREPESGKKKSFCLIKSGEILRLDQNHHYHHQVQGQCGVSGLQWNDFVLMTDLTLGDQGIHVERVSFDHTNWHGTSLPKLTDFYFKHIMPVLLRKSS